MIKKLLLMLTMLLSMAAAWAQVDVNKADAAALDSIRGLGPAKTKAILEERKKGEFKDWADLAKPGVKVIIPHPKTSGNGRYTYLAAWGAVLKKGGNEAQARDLVGKIFHNVPVLDAGGRGATTTFAQRGIGDVLLAWENEAYLALKEFGAEKFEIVTPSLSILAEPTVSVVDKVVDKRGTRAVAQAHLDYLYSAEGQDLAGQNYYRPIDPAAATKYGKLFPKINLFTIDEAFGGWTKAQKTHFADGGSFDQIYAKK